MLNASEQNTNNKRDEKRLFLPACTDGFIYVIVIDRRFSRLLRPKFGTLNITVMFKFPAPLQETLSNLLTIM